MKEISTINVPYASAVHDDEELKAVTEVLNAHQTIIGPRVAEFEKKVAPYFGKKYGVMVNSGSSANLLAVELLDAPAGSEVITPMVTFTTVVAPLVQKGLVPVFVDVELGTYQINIEQIERCISDKTKALLIPSLLGNVSDMERLRLIADKHHLVFIEDSCDTLGATFKDRPTGDYSDISTTSFYGSHIITAAGGGGMVCVNDDKWHRRLRVLRGWGRSSAVTESNDVEERYSETISGIQYDAKFIFETLGYNFLPLEISGAFGLVQLKKLPRFTELRQKNFANLLNFFKQYEKFFYLPKQRSDVKTNWLAFPLTIKTDAPFSRVDIVKHLEHKNIQTRPLFSGNIMRQPGFKSIKSRLPFDKYPVADQIMEYSFVIGCHHGLSEEQLNHIKNTFSEFIKKYN